MNRLLPRLLTAALLLCSLAGCKESVIIKDYRQDFDIEKRYLLIPIEDKGPESQVWIEKDGALVTPRMWIRVAQTKVDYWMPIDVEQYKGEKITLLYEHVKKTDIGFPMIKQSDNFDFDSKEQYRPIYHFSPKYAWTNDPNGMVYLDGEYHLFYQHNPYGSMWGNMHWGHAVTKDFKKWEHLPIAIAPDELGTIFSGSAVVDKNNTAGFGKNAIVALYTYEGETQTQGIAYSLDKGRTFTKYDGNPVISNPGIRDFRDPKVFWHTPTNKWIMSLATSQTITFYSSSDLKSWERLSEFGEGIGGHGGVWECPDLFPLRTPDGKEKWVLFVSINPGGPNGGSATQYFIGDFDGREFKADALDYPIWLDYGRDNYAGVTWSDVPASDGRRIFIGWMSNWDYTNYAPTLYFRNAMTLPRELTLGNSNGHLIVKSRPLAEVYESRGKAIKHGNATLSEKHQIDKLIADNKGAYEVEMELTPGNAKDFGFRLANAKGEYMEYRFDTAAGVLYADRTNSGNTEFSDKFPSKDSAPLAPAKSYKVELFVDKASAEIFINGGELVMTHTIFPTETYNKLELFSDGSQINAKNITIYSLK